MPFGATSVFGKPTPESYYRDKWCSEHKGKTEYRLLDRTRVDCLTDEYAVEFDFARKWAEAIGQALHYSLLTGRTGAVVLIIEKKSDARKKSRVERIVAYYRLPIKVFIMETE